MPRLKNGHIKNNGRLKDGKEGEVDGEDLELMVRKRRMKKERNMGSKKRKDYDNEMEETRDVFDLNLPSSRAMNGERMMEEEEECDWSLEEEEEEGWGKEKKSYYKVNEDSDEDEDGDDEWNEIEEEKEVKKVQRRRALEKSESDYLDDFGLKLESEEVEEKRVDKVVNDMSKVDKMDMIERDSPELLLLLDSFNEKMVEIRERLLPLLDRVRREEMPTSNGLSYLEVKYHLLLNYCTNICFYLLLKAEGGCVKDHPVIEQLARTRIIIDKLKPLDQKLKYQIDKLLKMASLGGEQGESERVMDEKLKCRSKILEVEEEEVEEEQVEEEQVEEEEEEQVEEEEEKVKERRVKSGGGYGYHLGNAMKEYVMDNISDKPIERHVQGMTMVNGGEWERKWKSERDLERYEEENFVRVRKRNGKEGGGLANEMLKNELLELEDFGDEVMNKEIEKSGLKSSWLEMKEVMEGKGGVDGVLLKLDKKSEKSMLLLPEVKGEVECDEFLKSEGERKSRKVVKSKKEDRNECLADSDDDEMYQEVSRNFELKKGEKKGGEKGEEERRQTEDEVLLEKSGGKRKITRDIERNDVLHKKHSKHSKEKSHPRVKHKIKYQNALRRRKGAVTPMRDRSKPYRGEEMGVNRRVVKSVKLDD